VIPAGQVIMIKVLKPSPGGLLRPEIERLVEDFGRRDVLWAAIGAVFRRGSSPMDAGDLPEYIRRDIGLPPAASARDWRQLR
jgi:hypothetical protein